MPLIDPIFSAKHFDLAEVNKAISKAYKDRTPDQHLYILQNYTLNGIEAFLKYWLLPTDITVACKFGVYNVIEQEVLNPNSELYQSNPKVIVLSQILETFVPNFRFKDWSLVQTQERLEHIFDKLREQTRAQIIVNTFEPLLPLPEDARLTNLAKNIRALNTFIRNYCEKHRDQFYCIDFGNLLALCGRNASIDLRMWELAKAPFQPHFLSRYAQSIARVVSAVSGKVKKALILDCDNTLWGGIVGEDGKDGIQLSPQDYPGSSYHEFQNQVVSLQRQGVILCLCSKNNEKDVIEILDTHTDCVIKKQDIAVMKINWNNKVENIREIVKTLNLGLDACVYIDDSSFECEMIASMLPELTVYRVPDKRYDLPKILIEAQPFFRLNVTSEDLTKTQQYQSEQKRSEVKAAYNDIDEYLKQLEISVEFRKMQDHEIDRCSQLTQKTNQFNLTTRRYSPAEIKAMHEGSNHILYILKVSDRFGDLGLTNLCIVELETNHKARVDTFLMSCRVFERKLEHYFASRCFENLISTVKVNEINAEFVPSAKNAVAANFLSEIGFSQRDASIGRKLFNLDPKEFSWDRKFDHISESSTHEP